MTSQFFKSLMDGIKAALSKPAAETSAAPTAADSPQFVDPDPVPKAILAEWALEPSRAWPYLNHRSGYTRQAALGALSGPITSAAQLIAIAQRLNDWVPEVRSAALAAADRLFPTAMPDVVEEAAPFLLSRWTLWQRWDNDGIAALDALIGQPRVVSQIVHSLSGKRFRKVSWRLEHLLRHDWIDHHLVELAQSAKEPSIRGLAFATLLRGEARWRSRSVRSAEELRYAVDKRAILFDKRPLTVGTDLGSLVEAGLRDRFAVVRWAAAGALVDRLVDIPDPERAIARLLTDKSRKVRERGQFLARREGIPVNG